jgi:hypothetical protein
MTITISNLTVAPSAPTGTLVGVLTARDAGSIIPCNFILSKRSSGYFAISSNNLITVWSGSIAPGYYPVRVRAVGISKRFSDSATFIINVTAVPSLPTPTGITFVTTTISLPDNSPAGTTAATFSVSMSDGSSFAGTLGASPAGTVAISGSMRLVLARALTSADDGLQQWTVSATQNGVTVSSSIAVHVIPLSPPAAPPPPPSAPPPSPQPTPTGVTFTPSAASLPDSAAVGTTVAGVSVSMSDGSAFTGTLAANPSGTVAILGNNLVLARALTPADNGPHQWGVTTTQNGVTVSGSIPVQVNAVPTSVTFTPSAASLPDSAAAGTTVAAVAVSMSDGSAFSGTLGASPAGTVTISGKNLVLARALTSADNGPHQWTVAATQNGATVSGSIPVQVDAASQPPPAPPPPPPPAPPPTPTSVTFTPSAASLPDNAAAGTTVAAVAVSMSDGSAFSGTLAASPAGTVTISGKNLVLARAYLGRCRFRPMERCCYAKRRDRLGLDSRPDQRGQLASACTTTTTTAAAYANERHFHPERCIPAR